MEIDARGETFQEFDDFGNQLILDDHYESENIRHKLVEMQASRDTLERAWKARQARLDQCLELQLFNRDCETAEQWMKSREDALRDDDTRQQAENSVEAAIKRHEDFDRAINAQEEKIANLQAFANTLIGAEHYDAANVRARIDAVLERWQKLRQALLDHRSKLGESQTLQDFSRDADEIEAWIIEKLQATSDDAVKDTANIQVTHISYSSLLLLLHSHTHTQSEIMCAKSANNICINVVINVHVFYITKMKCVKPIDKVKVKLIERICLDCIVCTYICQLALSSHSVLVCSVPFSKYSPDPFCNLPTTPSVVLILMCLFVILL